MALQAQHKNSVADGPAEYDNVTGNRIDHYLTASPVSVCVRKIQNVLGACPASSDAVVLHTARRMHQYVASEAGRHLSLTL